MIKYFVFDVFQTFAAIGDFGSVVEQLLMTHGKKITSKIYSILYKMWKYLAYTLYMYSLSLLSQRLMSWIPRCIKARSKSETNKFWMYNELIHVFCICIGDGHKETFLKF